ncbi:MAG: PTS sugar transporter subunit IIA [Simkaniaceae bacterium]|nr:PTS sugar transporter subunit IIA [Simkaniaceae bacterium]MCF7852490.1 PTS sugar transporter subunit IIA [Simkaniaceae bacterium]
MDDEISLINETPVSLEEGIVFDPELITFIDEPKDQDHVLRILTDLLYENGKIHDPELFFDAILQREKIVSTGIGLGVAIPHAKLDIYSDFFIAVGILTKKGVDWNSIDHAPVRVVFLIGGPADRQNEYLHILSSITKKMRSGDIRNHLIMTKSREAAFQQLS